MNQHNSIILSPLSDICNATSFVVQQSLLLVASHTHPEVLVHSMERHCQQTLATFIVNYTN